MAGGNYLRLDIAPFGRQLFRTGDLDPVYIALLGAVPNKEQLARWLVAYWAFYNSGFASWASERTGNKFWDCLAIAAMNEQPTPFYTKWPRGAERRHFRGAASVEAVARWRKRYGPHPEAMIVFLLDGDCSVRQIIARAKTHYLFGDWISFKVADMLDAVWGAPVTQDDLSVFLYDTPRQSIVEGWANKTLPLRAKTEEAALPEAMLWLQGQLKDCTVPHKLGHKPDWFSLETVWCKHLSHLHGHYPLLKDITEISHGMQPWCVVSKTAAAFTKHLPKGDTCKTWL